MNIPFLAASTAGSGILTWFGVWILRNHATQLGLIDIPNERSSHTRPTPRAGGAAFVVSTIAVFLAGAAISHQALALGIQIVLTCAMFIAIVSLADDRWRLPSRVRFAAHLIAACVVVFGAASLVDVEWQDGMVLLLGPLGIPASILWVVGATNIYNFMDGIDGLAGVQAVVTATAAAWIAMVRGDDMVALLLLIVAVSVLGFLAHNWPPAKIFMGDVGSAFLGFTFAGLSLVVGGTSRGTVPFLAWVLLLSPFLFDSSVTLTRRVLRGERWHEAHREHIYQRLVRAGWSHRTVTLVYLAADLFAASVVIAHFAYGIGSPLIAVPVATLPLAAIAGIVRHVEASRPVTAG